jgi:hypothetical protein
MDAPAPLTPNCGSPCRSAILAASLACCLLLAARLPAQESPSPETQKIRGTVINSVTHEPIGHALVYSPDNRLAGFTDSEGHFEFTIPVPPTPTADSRRVIQVIGSRPLGLNVLLARKPGFLNDFVHRVTVDLSGKDLTIPLVPEALIVGHVALPSSEPPDRIQLELYRRQVRDGRAHWEMQASAASRSTGEFRFAELRAGSYKLLTRELLDRDPLTFNPQGPQFGFPPVYFPAASGFAGAQTIELAPGKTFEASITLAKQPYYSVKVAIANALTPGGMEVLVYPHGQPGPGYSLRGGSNIEGLLPSGTYTLEVADNGGANPAAGSTSIIVKGAPLEAALALVPTSSISVNVKEEFTESRINTGSAVEVNGSRDSLSIQRRQLSTYLEPADDFALRQNSSLRPRADPADQSLVIENIVPGRYWVKVNSSHGFVSSATCGGIDLQQHPLVVSGGASPPIEITMRDDWAEVDGTVEGHGPSSSPFQSSVSSGSSPQVYFVPLPDSSGEFRDAWVGPDGKFNAQQIPPGVYRVLAFDRSQQELEYHNSEAMRAYESKGQMVRLVGNQKEHLRLQLIATNE